MQEMKQIYYNDASTSFFGEKRTILTDKSIDLQKLVLF
jgi:hypothetical protein